VKVSPNSVDQAKGEDADDDSTYVQVTNWLKMSQYPIPPAQPENSLSRHSLANPLVQNIYKHDGMERNLSCTHVSGVQSTIAKGVLQKKVKR
jgi:hypothetical protein